MILAVDVDYTDGSASVAGLAFDNWSDQSATAVYTSTVDHVDDYIPGQFYRRELPCILKLLEQHRLEPDIIIIDGLVYLDGHTEPGLGKYLFDALDGKTVVIGVAKSPYREISSDYALFRGSSRNPLYVTSIGVAVDDAKTFVSAMHGDARVPTLLKQVDRVCRHRH